MLTLFNLLYWMKPLFDETIHSNAWVDGIATTVSIIHLIVTSSQIYINKTKQKISLFLEQTNISGTLHRAVEQFGNNSNFDQDINL